MGIEITAGPSGDFIEVHDPLPLTIHLGGGSDKFIGSGNDYCRHGGGSDG